MALPRGLVDVKVCAIDDDLVGPEARHPPGAAHVSAARPTGEAIAQPSGSRGSAPATARPRRRPARRAGDQHARAGDRHARAGATARPAATGTPAAATNTPAADAAPAAHTYPRRRRPHHTIARILWSGPRRLFDFYWGEGIADDVPALAYYLVLSLAPFALGLAALEALLLKDVLSAITVADQLNRFLPEALHEDIRWLVVGTRDNSPLLLALALFAMLWTTSGGIGVIERCLSRILDVPAPQHRHRADPQPRARRARRRRRDPRVAEHLGRDEPLLRAASRRAASRGR